MQWPPGDRHPHAGDDGEADHDAHGQHPPRVPALANWTTRDGVSRTSGKPRRLARVFDSRRLPAGFAAMPDWPRDAVVVLFVPEVVVVVAVIAGVSLADGRPAWQTRRIG